MAEEAGEPHVAGLLALYYADALDASEGARVERHLAVCDACRGAASEAAETVAALELLTPEDKLALSREDPPPPH
ncbi:zf-HC2 domain-containing protein [Actinoplanes sp. URMC 104]|uniref:zf-HC2 domain-containing protein n=1 Tax=Actinoplanes sp. URMC 104 TaxID=3423409 RepID=UPI003F1DFF3F